YAHHRCQVVVYDVLVRKVDAVGGVGAGGNDELDRGAFGDRAGPLHIEIGFGLFARTDDAGIGSVDHDLGVVAGQSKCGAECRDVGEVDVGAPGDSDRL